MFIKLHIKLTAFCTVVTGLLLIVMSIFYLKAAEESVWQSGAAEYSSMITTVSGYLETQTTIPQQWLAQMESNQKFIIRIYDNDQELLYNQLHGKDVNDKILELALDSLDAATGNGKTTLATDTFTAVTLESSGTSANIQQQSSRRYDKNGRALENKIHIRQDYSAAIDINDVGKYSIYKIIFPKENGTLSAVILYPWDRAEQSISQQRSFFILLDGIGILILGVFAWFFTGHLMGPIEKSRRRQTEFVAAASHELRSPLTVILSGLSALKDAPQDKTLEFIDTIESEGHRMARLIDDMLALARADNQTWSLDTRLCDADTLLLEAYEKYEPLAREKDICLDIRLPETPLPQVECDPGRISQVLAILMDNALTYVPAGGSIHMRILRDRSFLKFCIIDNGPGVPDAHKEKIFERFYRMDQAHKDKQHFGLGLCIAREIMELHHGTLTVEDSCKIYHKSDGSLTPIYHDNALETPSTKLPTGTPPGAAFIAALPLK